MGRSVPLHCVCCVENCTHYVFFPGCIPDSPGRPPYKSFTPPFSNKPLVQTVLSPQGFYRKTKKLSVSPQLDLFGGAL